MTSFKVRGITFRITLNYEEGGAKFNSEHHPGTALGWCEITFRTAPKCDEDGARNSGAK